MAQDLMLFVMALLIPVVGYIGYTIGKKHAVEMVEWTLERSDKKLSDVPRQVEENTKQYIAPELLMAHGVFVDEPVEWEPEKTLDEIIKEKGGVV